MINDFFISSALAQTTSLAAGSGSSLSSFVPLLVIFVIFYLLIIRPQSKKIKDHQTLVDNLKINNKVVTSSGIYGKITAIDSKNSKVTLEIADGVNIIIGKSYINDLDKSAQEEKKKETKAANKKKKNK